MSANLNILMGIGNECRNDDGVRVYIANNFKEPDWLVLNCATAPENFTSVIKKHNPENLIIVDATLMDLPPGSFRLISADGIKDAGIGTHSLPLYLLIDFLRPAVKHDILFIGIQPKVITDGSNLSSEVIEGSNILMNLLKEKSFDQIETYR